MLNVDDTFINEKSGTFNVSGVACIGVLWNSGTINIGVGGSINGPECAAQTDSTLAEIITSADSFGVFDYSGPVMLGGTLDVDLQNRFIPAIGESFDFINFAPGELNGTFTGIQNEFFNNNTGQWVVNYDDADVKVL